MIRKSLALLIGSLVTCVVAMGSFIGGWRMASEFTRAMHRGCFPPPSPVFARNTPEEVRDTFAIFWDVWDIVQNEFYHTEPLDQKAMIYGAIRGMLQSLGDEYTVFEEPVAAERTREEIRGTFEGIGVIIRREGDTIIIAKPMPKSPALKAGIRAGDILLQIDGVDVANLIAGKAPGLDLEEISQRVRGPRGSKVRLTLRRPPDPKPFILEVMRDEVPLVSVNAAMLAGTKVAYLQITDFRGTTPGEVDEALSELLPQNPSGLILDLRNNHGGVLRASQEILGRFYTGVALYEKDRNGNLRTFETIKSAGALPIPQIPLVVLVNDHTASAAEVVAGALAEQREHTTLIGTESYGKGSVQNVHRLSDGSNLRVTVAQWLTPKQRVIHKAGIIPHYIVPYSQDPIYAMPCIGDRTPPAGQTQCPDAQLAWGVWYLTEGKIPPTSEAKPSVPTTTH